MLQQKKGIYRKTPKSRSQKEREQFHSQFSVISSTIQTKLIALQCIEREIYIEKKHNAAFSMNMSSTLLSN